MKQFNTIIANPPFQDRNNRGKTQHKLWIDFTVKELTQWLTPEGTLYQISPSSFRSPSNKILTLLKTYQTCYLDFSVGTFFPNVGSSFAAYIIKNQPNIKATKIVNEQGDPFSLKIDDKLFYLPTSITPEALSIHQKVIFNTTNKLPVLYDYNTCHNAKLKLNPPVLSKTQTTDYPHPVFHTNNQIWYSNVKQDWAAYKKIMWTRSGYTKPFYDDGVMGGTDMCYYSPVSTKTEGKNLTHNLNLKLIKYILSTARWSGFGNEKVFQALPALPTDRKLTDTELYKMFNLTQKETDYVNSF